MKTKQKKNENENITKNGKSNKLRKNCVFFCTFSWTLVVEDLKIIKVAKTSH